jgi:aminopeptidase YwaD
MPRVLFLLICFCYVALSHAQVWEYRIAKHAIQVDRIEPMLLEYEQLGVKVTGSAAFDNATQWLAARYTTIGYTPRIDTFTFGSNTSYNVMIEKPGSKAGSWIIIGAHFDSKAPSLGANDNGSGVMATLEIARILKDVPCEVGIRIINFGGEEQGLYGSQHYVANKLDTNEDIQLMLNLDQLGGTKGVDNSKIRCERDENDNPSTNNALSALKTDTLARMMQLYTRLTPVINYAFSSDYIPFENAGYVITGLYQDSKDPHYHQNTDLVANMDIPTTTEVIKGAVAASLYFARLQTSVGLTEITNSSYVLYPNPATYSIALAGTSSVPLKLRIVNTMGQEVYSTVTQINESIDISRLPDGLYTVSISSADSAFLQFSKLIIAK